MTERRMGKIERRTGGAHAERQREFAALLDERTRLAEDELGSGAMEAVVNAAVDLTAFEPDREGSGNTVEAFRLRWEERRAA